MNGVRGLILAVVCASAAGCQALVDSAALEQELTAARLQREQLEAALAETREELAAAQTAREDLQREVERLQAELDRARGVRR